MWQPERPLKQDIVCALCRRSVRVADARKCNSCHKVVCVVCFDIPLGVCRECLAEFEDSSETPDYIA